VRKAPAPAVVASPVTDYAVRVVEGEIVAGRLVRLACQRHLRDLQDGAARGLWFDEEAAQFAIDFFEIPRHYVGEWAGRPLTLQPWQAFRVGSVFGWKRADGTRRFRKAYHEVARKNGKTTEAAAVGLLVGFFDGEPGAEVYCAATKRDQAKEVWDDAAYMVKSSPSLSRRLTVLMSTSHLVDYRTASKMLPLGADEGKSDGLNPHAVVCDELHAWKDRRYLSVLETAFGARRQPLTWFITTPGFDRSSLCWEEHDRAVRILEGVIENDDVFAYIASIDDPERWADPAEWPKANPNLGVSKKPEYLAAQVKDALDIPSKRNGVLRLELSVWTEQEERWIPVEVWNEGADPIDLDRLKGRRCYAGLDLARVRDLSALALLFPPESDGEKWEVLMRFWCPQEDIEERSRRDGVPYDAWARAGLLETTPGNSTDFGFIREAIIELGGVYDIREIAYDRIFAGEIVNDLMAEGFAMIPYGQHFGAMAAPVAEMERMLLARTLQHGGNPLLAWCASNAVVVQDAYGNRRVDKAKSTERVDGVVALLMALGRAMMGAPEEGVIVWVPGT